MHQRSAAPSPQRPQRHPPPAAPSSSSSSGWMKRTRSSRSASSMAPAVGSEGRSGPGERGPAGPAPRSTPGGAGGAGGGAGRAAGSEPGGDTDASSPAGGSSWEHGSALGSDIPGAAGTPHRCRLVPQRPRKCPYKPAFIILFLFNLYYHSKCTRPFKQPIIKRSLSSTATVLCHTDKAAQERKNCWVC